MKAHCLFEQSGTFKNEFKKLGFDAYDYDVLNDFGETDYQIDLFNEIDKAFEGGQSIFDNIGTDDVIMAFFPCIRFENQIMLSFRGQANQMKSWSMEQKIEYDMKLLDEVRNNYFKVSKLFLVCIRKGLKLIMENPYSEEHFLRRYWCYPASIIDRDRRDNGDYFAKPTQYWFVGFEPKYNVLFEPITYNCIESNGKGKDSWSSRRKSDYEKTGASSIKTARSMIHPDYANRFIRQYILEENEIG